MSRKGKIARLPNDIRQELNQRLQDGEEGGKLAAWLNGLPRVQQVLNEHFGGRPINEVNLCEWRKGGFPEWERHEEARELVESLAQRAADLGEDATGMAISDGIACLMSVELALYVEAVRRETAEPRERWERLQGLLRQVAQLRREDHRATRVRIERERWQAEVEQRKEEQRERERAEEKKRRLASLKAMRDVHLRAGEFGGGLKGRQVAAYVLEVERDLPTGSLTSRFEAPRKQAKKPPATPEPMATIPAKRENPKSKEKKFTRKHAAGAANRRRRPSRRPRVSKKHGGIRAKRAKSAMEQQHPPAHDTALLEKAPANALDHQPADVGSAESPAAPGFGEEDGQSMQPGQNPDQPGQLNQIKVS